MASKRHKVEGLPLAPTSARLAPRVLHRGAGEDGAFPLAASIYDALQNALHKISVSKFMMDRKYDAQTEGAKDECLQEVGGPNTTAFAFIWPFFA